ncbi:hypothetical protein ACOME3_002282 [Neoechinorhynchus agilis]
MMMVEGSLSKHGRRTIEYWHYLTHIFDDPLKFSGLTYDAGGARVSMCAPEYFRFTLDDEVAGDERQNYSMRGVPLWRNVPTGYDVVSVRKGPALDLKAHYGIRYLHVAEKVSFVERPGFTSLIGSTVAYGEELRRENYTHFTRQAPQSSHTVSDRVEEKGEPVGEDVDA